MSKISDKILEDLDFQNKEISQKETEAFVKTFSHIPQCYDNGTPIGRERVSESHYYLYNDEY